MSTSPISRRALLQAGAAAGAALAMPGNVRADWGEVRPPSRGKAFRVAHLTDMHVTPDRRAGEGYAVALRSLQTFNPGPQLVLTGGDHVMDSWATEPDAVRVEWELYQRVLKDNCTIPVRPVIGNHDVFGYGLPDKVPPETAGYGKAMYLDRMALPKSYYSFDAGGWHFVCLDNITRRPDKNTTYMALLDEEQDAWLRADLEKAKSAKTPICVVTHIPLLCVCAFFDEKFPKDSHDFPVNDSLMQHDPKPLLTLLRQHNVKLCLSGHIHLVDRIEYLGITFICDGAVSGNWWKGPRQEFPEGYGVIDFYPDGTFEHQFHTYGWVAKA